MKPIYVVWQSDDECTIYTVEDYTDLEYAKLMTLADKIINIDDVDPELVTWVCEYLVDKPIITAPREINGIIIKTGFAL